MAMSQSSPSLLFNAASMADLLGPAGGSRGKGKHGTKGKIEGSKSSSDMSKDLISSILQQETGETSMRRVAPGKKKKSGKRKGQMGNMSSNDSSRGANTTLKKISDFGSRSGSMMQPESHQKLDETGVVKPALDPLDMVRMAHNANNNVHVFAQGMVANSEEKFDGSANDDVNYLERQYQKVQNILKANERKLVDGYEQLVGEAGGPDAPSLRFNSEDAKLLLLFAGITEIDESSCEELCGRCEVTKLGRSNEERFAKAAEEFMEREERGDSEVKGTTNSTITGTDSQGNDPSLPEVNFHRWRIAVMANLRHRLMAGVLASRRGQLASNFIEQAEISANMVSILGPHPSTNRRQKASTVARGDVQSNDPSHPNVDDPDSDGEFEMDSVAEVRDLADDLFGDSLVETDGKSMRGKRARSADGGPHLQGSLSSLPIESGSFIHDKSFASAHGQDSLVDGLPPLQMPRNKSQQALRNRKRLQRKAGFDDSFTRSTPRVLHEMSRTDPGKGRRPLKGPGFGSSQSLAGAESVASVTSNRSQSSRQLQPGASMEDIMALKAELQNTQQGLQQLGSLVDTGIAWVHSNVDMREIAASGGLSDRTKERCRKLAIEKLFGTLGTAIESALSWSLQRWTLAVRYKKVSQIALVYSRAKSMETFMRTFNDALLRQYLKVWAPWKNTVAIKRRWEQECAAAEIQRIIRGFLGVRHTYHVRRHVNAIRIQCLARKVRAKKRVITRRKYLRLHRSAVKIQIYFKGLVLMRKAREECDRRRELKIARNLLRQQRAYQDRIKREAEEKMKRESAARKKAANRSAAAKIAERADKKAENKKSKGRAAPKGSPSKGAGKKGKKEGTGSPKSASASPEVYRPAPINPSATGRSRSPSASPTASSAYGGSPYAAGDAVSPYGDYGSSRAAEKSPHEQGAFPTSPTALNSMEDALRLKEEAENFLRQNDPTYAEMMRAKEEEIDQLRKHAAQQRGSARSPSPSGEGEKEKRGWFGSSSSSGASTEDSPGQDKKSWFSMSRKSPTGGDSAGGQPVSRINSIDSEIAEDRSTSPDGADKSPSGGMFGGLFSRKKDSPSTSPATVEADGGGQAVSRQPSIKEHEQESQQAKEEQFIEEDDEYLTPEQVAEQDRLRAIEEEKRILREKEEAYNESIRQKELALQEEAEAKGRAIIERDKIREEREAKERAAREEEEARQKAIQDALDEERRKQEEEEERLEAEEEEKERREAELERLRQEVIAEERANMQAELERIRKEAADAAAQMEQEREELKKLKLEAIGNVRNRGGGKSPAKISAQAGGGEPPSPGKGLGSMLGSMFGSSSRPSSAVSIKGFSADPTQNATAKSNDSKAANRPASAVATGTEGYSADSESGKSERPQSATGFGSMFSSMKSAFNSSMKKGSVSGGAFGGMMGRGPKRKFKPFDPDTYEFIERDEALRRIQCQWRIKFAKRRVQKRREKVTADHKRVGELLLWAIVLIQRTARARQGRHRFRRIKKMKAEAHERLRERSATKIQSIIRAKFARNRVKLLWMKRGEELKAAEWKDYQKKTDRKAKLKVLAAGTPRPDVDEDNDIVTWGVDPEQVNELDQKIAKLEAIEKSIEAREKAMADSQRISEERAKILEEQLRRLEERQKAEEAERAMQAELMSNAMGSVPNTGRSSSYGSARGPPPQHLSSARRGTGRGSAPPSARGPPTNRSSARSQPQASSRHSAPPTARSAREEGIPKDAPRMTHEGVEWVQLWDPDESAMYWYCESTQAAQWETPGEPAYDYSYDSGYDTDHTSGAMTDYSTDYASGAESEWSEWKNEGDWQEYWDENAQAKYWYNEITGEASWTPPDDLAGGSGSASVPASARQMPDEWVSYVDEATGQEYWYNSRTGETSWA